MRTILFRLVPYDKISFWYAILIVIYTGIITIIQRRTGMQMWRIMCTIPVLLSVGHFFIFHFKGYEKMTLALYGMIYLTTVVIAVWPFINSSHNTLMAWCVNVLAVVSLACYIIVPGFMRPHTGNYTQDKYVSCFESIICQMEKDYILSDWKEIDYEKIKKEIMPMVETAEETADEALFCMALLRYQYYFYDGHVMLEAINTKGEEALFEAKRRLAGNDYGFSMLRLDDGSVIAILVDENSEAYKKGIRFGTQIKTFDGVEINEAIDGVECVYPDIHSFPVKSNEDYVKPIFLAGKAGETLEMDIVNGKSEEKIRISKMGDYVERLDEALKLFYHRVEDDYDNFECIRLKADCGYMRIKSEFVSNQGNFDAQLKDDYTSLVNEIDEKIECIGDIKTLIIDMRNNGGGYDLVSLAVTSLFTDEEWFAYSDGKMGENGFEPLDAHYMKGTGKRKNLEIRVLVNSECRSAGDSMTYYLSKLPNVTVYGITRNNGIDQNPGGYCITSNGCFGLKYPIGPVIDENGLPMIDTKADREPRVPLDKHIELNYDAAKAIFEDKIDYELDYITLSPLRASTLP